MARPVATCAARVPVLLLEAGALKQLRQRIEWRASIGMPPGIRQHRALMATRKTLYANPEQGRRRS